MDDSLIIAVSCNKCFNTYFGHVMKSESIIDGDTTSLLVESFKKNHKIQMLGINTKINFKPCECNK